MGIETAILASAGANLIGSAMAGKSAEKAAKTSANAQLRAAELAAEEQRFRPVGISTRFGTSQFGFDEEGRLKSAGYTATPELQAIQDRLSALYGQNLGMAEAAAPQATRLFNLGAGYVAETPEASRQRIFNELQAARLPAQLQEEQRLGAGVFGRGRAGLNIGGMGQPELYSLAAAREAQRAQDIVAANQQAQQQTQFGVGLMGQGLTLPTTALSPFQTAFGTALTTEQAAQQALDIGAQLGGRTATAGQAAGQSLLTGGLGAAQTRLQGSLVGPTLMSQGISSFGNQYMQNQQQQQLFDRLYGGYSPYSSSAANAYFGSSPTPAVPPVSYNFGTEDFGAL